MAGVRLPDEDPLAAHKTTHRAVYDRALQECPGFDDVLLRNERGEVTESAVANLVVLRTLLELPLAPSIGTITWG